MAAAEAVGVPYVIMVCKADMALQRRQQAKRTGRAFAAQTVVLERR